MNVKYFFSGKKVLVTGGASGIGLAAVEAFLASGAEVAVLDIKFEKETRAGQLWQIPVDLTDSAQIIAAFAQIEAAWGALDIVINNAGIEYVASLEDTDEEAWDRVFATNIKSYYLCCKAALPMLRQSKGTIVNTASQLAMVGASSFTAYTSAKAAVVNFTKSLALETAKDGIRVNTVCPGAVDTPLLRRQFAEGKRGPQGTLDDLIGMHPIGRLGQPEEIASCILFLSSDASTFMTGSSLVVDGGYISF